MPFGATGMLLEHSSILAFVAQHLALITSINTVWCYNNFFCEIETPLPFRQTQLHSEINTKKFDYLRALVLTSLY